MERSLGRGGQARAWIAHDSRSNEDVLLKVFRLADADGWKKFELFERECKVLRSLSHPFIPRYLEHGGDEDAGMFYLAMSLVHGTSLQQAIDEGARFTDLQLQALLDRLLSILEYLHELNPQVIHRDIKPGNVVLNDDGAWLVDFGSVRDALRDGRKSTVVGTFGYMAPEQIRSESTAASDLYGLAATIVAAATGQDPASLPSSGLEIDLESCMKPSRLRDVLGQMLRADPRERLQSVAQVRAKLEHESSTFEETRALDVRRDSVPENWRAAVCRLARTGRRESAIALYQNATGATYSAAIRGTDLIVKQRTDAARISAQNTGIVSVTIGATLIAATATAAGLAAFHPVFLLFVPLLVILGLRRYRRSQRLRKD